MSLTRFMKRFGIFGTHKMQREETGISRRTNQPAIFHTPFFRMVIEAVLAEILFSLLPGHTSTLLPGEERAVVVHGAPILRYLPVFQFLKPKALYLVAQCSR